VSKETARSTSARRPRSLHEVRRRPLHTHTYTHIAAMEMSSPLAAMQPPTAIPGPWGYRRDLPPSKPLFGAHNLGSKNFNFRDMSMRKADVSSAGYFGVQPMRGSSPTASLAADMSSNLHVDQRYGPPLHRRSFHCPPTNALC
jgi:hypothetical protein